VRLYSVSKITISSIKTNSQNLIVDYLEPNPKQNMKKCLFQDPFGSSCSSEPIIIDLKPSPTSTCFNKTIEAFISLPHEFGSPIAWMYSCEEPCNYRDIPKIMPVTWNGNDTYSFTKPLADGESNYFKLLVSGIDCLQEICSYTFNSTFFGDCQSNIRKRGATAYENSNSSPNDVAALDTDWNFSEIPMDSAPAPSTLLGFFENWSFAVAIAVLLCLLIVCLVLSRVKISKMKRAGSELG